MKDKKKELIDKIFQDILLKLKDPKDWKYSDDLTVMHKTLNIYITKSYLRYPDTIQIPIRYKYKIRRLIRHIHDHYELIRMSFIFDYLIGVYPHYFSFVGKKQQTVEEIKKWIKIEVGTENYKIVEHVIYFKQHEDHAMFVLKWI